jgi:hypothetical protein
LVSPMGEAGPSRNSCSQQGNIAPYWQHLPLFFQ